MPESPDDLARRLYLAEEPVAADLVLAFGSSDAAESLRRAASAAELFARGFAPRLLLSGGDPGGRGVTEAELMAREATRLGVPPDALRLEGRSATTAENVLRSRELLERAGELAGVRAIILVSSWWHLRRCRAMAADAFGPGVRLTCCAADVPVGWQDWAHTPEGQRLLECESDLLAAALAGDEVT